MNLTDLNPPFIELPERQTWHRIQRSSWRKDSVRTRGFILPPFGVPTGRFDLSDEPTAYLADSELTSCYEALFRRDTRSYTLDQLRQRSLVAFRTAAGMRLVDLRGLEENYPVLQSLRYETTQAFAADARLARPRPDLGRLRPVEPALRSIVTAPPQPGTPAAEHIVSVV